MSVKYSVLLICLCVLQLLQIYLAYLVCVSEIQCSTNLSVCVAVAADLPGQAGIPGLDQPD